MSHKLPEHWTEKPLGDVASVKRRKVNPKVMPQLRFVGMDHVEAHTMRLVGTVPAYTMSSNAVHFFPGDVLYGRLRPYLNKVYQPNFEGLASAEFIPLTVSDELDPSFLQYLLNSTIFVRFTSTLDTGDRPRVSYDQISTFEVPLPSFEEQQQIVASIESCFSRLENTIASLKAAQTKLKNYRASILKAAVEGRLVPTEAELASKEGRDYEPASVLLDRILQERKRRWIEDAAETGRAKAEEKAKKAGKTWTADDDAKALEREREKAAKKYKQPVAPDTESLPELPEGWCWATVEQLTAYGPQNGLYVPQREYGEGMPILRIDDYQFDFSKPNEELRQIAPGTENATHYALNEGDIVINRVNSPSHLGKALVIKPRNIPAVFESNMMRLSITTDVVPDFVVHYLESVDGRRRLTANAKWAVNQASINQRDVVCTAVPLAPGAEQVRIIREIEKHFSAIIQVTRGIGDSSERLGSLRQSILRAAFQGLFQTDQSRFGQYQH